MPTHFIEKTKSFNTEVGTYNSVDEMPMRTLIGIVLGFTSTGLFFIYAGIRIIMDEIHRTKFYKAKVAKCEERLEKKYDFSVNAIAKINEDFFEKDAGKKAKKVEEEAEEEGSEEVEESADNAEK